MRRAPFLLSSGGVPRAQSLADFTFVLA